MDRLAYAAHTRSAIFYLDEAGVCQELAPASADEKDVAPELLRCVGAQYVASLDLTAPSGLVPLPRERASMLFVVADPHMHYSLVRTAPVDRFETLASVDEVEVLDDDPLDNVIALDVDPDEDEESAPASEIPVDVEEAFELRAAVAFAKEPPPDVHVAWPTNEALARQLPPLRLPLPSATFELMAPPRPTRRASVA